MSVPEIRPPPPPRPEKQGLGGCAMVFLVFVGLALLLPGLCSLIVMGSLGGGDSTLSLLFLVCFAIAGCGIWLIIYAIRNR